jgi:hypothetical protein
MSQSKDDRKSAKKAAKAAAKIAKKQHATVAPPSDTASGLPPSKVESSSEPTAAERSARAAERKVLWEQRRFWLTVISVLVALAALVVTLLSKWSW